MYRCTSREPLVLEIAASQHGVISAEQLRSLGVGRSWVHRRLASGSWVRCLPGVYAVGPSAYGLSPDGWGSAAVLSAPQPAALSHEAAARRWGAWKRGRTDIHVVATVRRDGVTAADGSSIHFHRSRSIHSDDIVVLDGVRVTTFARTIVDLGARLTSHQIAHVLHQGAFLGLLDLADVLLRIERRHGCPWSRVARTGVQLYQSGSAGTRSATEDRFLRRWLQLELPEPAVNDPGSVDLAGIEPDFAWRDRRLVVELDGSRSHDRPNDSQRDPVRDAALTAAGWRVVRIPSDDVWRDVDACVAHVRASW